MNYKLDNYPFDLGKWSFKISTSSYKCQKWFDYGIQWCFGFNHEEAKFCFEKAIQEDQSCAMAYFGVAYSMAEHYNKQWPHYQQDQLNQNVLIARNSLKQAVDFSKNGILQIEIDIINAQCVRFDPLEKENVDLNDLMNQRQKYINAMETIYLKYENDADICSLYCEAMMNQNAWNLWDWKKGIPKFNALFIESILEKAMIQHKQNPHPNILHLYIHLLEQSPHPEKALIPSNQLRNLTPDLGHLVHMVSHIDHLIGNYNDSVIANTKAIQADEYYLTKSKVNQVNFYIIYRIHNMHYKVSSSMMQGNFKNAMQAANQILNFPQENLLTPLVNWLEGFYGVIYHVLIRFGKFKEIICIPEPKNKELFVCTTAVYYYAMGIAYAVLGQIEQAENYQILFLKQKSKVPLSRIMFKNPFTNYLQIATNMLDGEILYRKNSFQQAFEKLNNANNLYDNLLFDDPWGWMQPTRHAYGALLLEQNYIEDAEKCYKEDLGIYTNLPRVCQHPNNIWSLKGLVECLQTKQSLNNENKLLLEQLLNQIQIQKQFTDFDINRSCFCRLNINI